MLQSIITTLVFISFLYSSTFSQTKILEEDNITKTNLDSNSTFISVEIMPEFPGGDEGLNNYMQKTIKYPKKEKRKGIKGTVYVYFVINKQGMVQDAKVVRGIKEGPGLNEEALRAIKNMPTWKPGMQSGRYVNVCFTYPVKFTIKE